MNWERVKRDRLRLMGILLAGGLLVILGYGIGTPRLFIAPIDYLSKAIPAAIRFSTYGVNSGVSLGLYGQWIVLGEAVGVFAYYLFMIAFIWYVFRLFLHWAKKNAMSTPIAGILIVVLNVVLFDLPFLISINYIPRHFIPFMPLLAILGALFVNEILHLAARWQPSFTRPIVAAIMTVGIFYSFSRLASFTLLFLNDARIPASAYIAEIRGYQKSMEYTLYPPIIEKKRFIRAHNYPIYFIKYPNEVVPTGGRFEYNLGEQGLLERQTDYFVVDSFTYGRFDVPSICETNPVECEFFKRLLAGQVETYRLVADFHYQLPSYLPQVSVAPVNPDVKIFERVP